MVKGQWSTLPEPTGKSAISLVKWEYRQCAFPVLSRAEEKQATWEGQGNIFKNYILQKPKLKGQRQEIIEDHQDKLD